MAHKSRSVNNSRCEAKRIYNQRRYIKKLEEENKKLKQENIKIAIMYLLRAYDYIHLKESE